MADDRRKTRTFNRPGSLYLDNPKSDPDPGRTRASKRLKLDSTHLHEGANFERLVPRCTQKEPVTFQEGEDKIQGSIHVPRDPIAADHVGQRPDEQDMSIKQEVDEQEMEFVENTPQHEEGPGFMEGEPNPGPTPYDDDESWDGIGDSASNASESQPPNLPDTTTTPLPSNASESEQSNTPDTIISPLPPIRPSLRLIKPNKSWRTIAYEIVANYISDERPTMTWQEIREELRSQYPYYDSSAQRRRNASSGLHFALRPRGLHPDLYIQH